MPSLQPLHVHIISEDFGSSALKHKKHLNSFCYPFFIPIEEVEARLEESPEGLGINSHAAEALLKQEMKCHRCGCLLKNIKDAKQHLSSCNVVVKPSTSVEFHFQDIYVKAKAL